MPITAYSGLPRSGKSHSAVKYAILPSLKEGIPVWTNIPMQDLAKEEYPGLIHSFNMKDVAANDDWFQTVLPKGVTIVMDELMELWPSGVTAKNALQQHKEFLTQHGHMIGENNRATEVIFICQDLNQISAFARNLVNTTYRTVKLDALGRPKEYRCDVYQGAVTGPAPSDRQKVRELFGKYDPEVYKYYVSQTQSITGAHGSEQVSDDRNNIFNSKYYKYFIPVAGVFTVAMLYFAISFVGGLFEKDEPIPTVQTHQIPNTAAVQNPKVTPIPPPPPKPKKHRHFYEGMTAYIAYNNGHYPWNDYRIAFVKDGHQVVVDPEQLGKLGYKLIGLDACFVQLIGHGDTLNIFCSPSTDIDDGDAVFDL